MARRTDQNSTHRLIPLIVIQTSSNKAACLLWGPEPQSACVCIISDSVVKQDGRKIIVSTYIYSFCCHSLAGEVVPCKKKKKKERTQQLCFADSPNELLGFGHKVTKGFTRLGIGNAMPSDETKDFGVAVNQFAVIYLNVTYLSTTP